MKNTLRYYAPVAGLLAGILVLSVLLTAFTGQVLPGGEKPTVLTTVYPLYTAAKAVIGDTDGVELVGLSGSAGGCLHDYQLSPADRLALQQADLLLLNGAGAEGFLEDLLPTLSAVTVDTSAGLPLLCGEEHHHEEHHHDHTYNEHLWTSPTRYGEQVQQVVEALCTLDPANAAAYRANGAAYRAEIAALGDQLRQAVAALPTRNCVIFDSSLAYFAEDMGLTCVLALQAGEDEGLSAAQLKAVEEVLAADPHTLLLYDSQYDLQYGSLAGKRLQLDTAVTTDWLTAMTYNLTQLKKLTEGME